MRCTRIFDYFPIGCLKFSPVLDRLRSPNDFVLQSGYIIAIFLGLNNRKSKEILRRNCDPICLWFQVAGEVTLNELHQILQTVMGWGNYHMHLFRIGKEEYGENFAEEDLLGSADFIEDSDVRLEDLITRRGRKFKYIYDFGDDWTHTLKVEKIEPRTEGGKLPFCMDGQRACPPEDCGSIQGYQNILEMLSRPANPKDEEETLLREWVGAYDPVAFDPGTINRALAHFRKRTASP